MEERAVHSTYHPLLPLLLQHTISEFIGQKKQKDDDDAHHQDAIGISSSVAADAKIQQYD